MELNFYNDIHEMPIYNWFMIGKNGDYNYLLKDFGKVHNKDNHSLFEAQQMLLTQQYLDLYGVADEAKMLMIYYKRKIDLTCDYIITGKKILKAQIMVVQSHIDKLIPKEFENKESLERVLVALSKFMGYGVKGKETSVVEYKEMINLLEEHNKANKNGTKTDTGE